MYKMLLHSLSYWASEFINPCFDYLHISLSFAFILCKGLIVGGEVEKGNLIPCDPMILPYAYTPFKFIRLHYRMD